MARELGEQLNRLAQRDADPAHLLEAHDTLGNTLFFLGEYVGARMHLEQGLALTDLGGVWGMLVYAWFSEGFDTADLQEASALLKTLM